MQIPGKLECNAERLEFHGLRKHATKTALDRSRWRGRAPDSVRPRRVGSQANPYPGADGLGSWSFGTGVAKQELRDQSNGTAPRGLRNGRTRRIHHQRAQIWNLLPVWVLCCICIKSKL
jgi:hypothetical protein